MKKFILGYLLIVAMLLTGCWDKVELDKRIFVLGMGVDSNPAEHQEEHNSTEKKSNKDLYRLTLELSSLKQKDSGGGGKGPSAPEHASSMVETDVGSSVFEIIRKKATESDKILFFGHQQALLIGESMARQRNLNQVVDLMMRDHEVDRSMHIFLVQGNAKDIFQANPKNSQTVSNFLMNQSEQQRKSSRFISMDFTTFLSKLVEGGNLLVGSVSYADDKDVKVSGSGVIKEGTLVGWLDDDETRAALFVLNEVKGGEFDVQDPTNEDSFITFEISKAKTQVKSYIENSIPRFSIEIKVQGKIAEIDRNGKRIDEKNITKAEKAVSGELEKQIKGMLKKLQKQYEADVLGFGDALRKHHNREWKGIEKDWPKLFPTVPISVTATTQVRWTGRTY